MEKHKDNQEQDVTPVENEVETSELSSEELDEASGGMIIYGKRLLDPSFVKVSLTPQPLTPKSINIGEQH
jgi:hypothetical protein